MADLVPLGHLVGNSGLIVDGDWVESKDQDPDGNVRLVQLADIGVGLFLDKSRRFMTAEKAATLKCTFLNEGDILVARMPDPLGRACQFPGDERKCVTVVDVCIIRPDAGIADAAYVTHVLNSVGIRQQLDKFIKGTTRQRISRTNLEKIRIPLPSLREQRRIAAILDKADALRAKRREALGLLDELQRGIFVEMFGDFPAIFDRWTVKPLDELLDFLTSGSRGWAEYYSESGAIFLRIQNVRRNELNLEDVAFVSPPDSAEARRTRVREGDVLLSITADLGRTAVIPAGLGCAHINQHLAILRTVGILPKFLSAFLASPAGLREVMGRNKQGVKAGLNFEDIKSFRIPTPPQTLQQDFVVRLEQIRQQIATHKLSLTELDSLFSSLQRRAFQGEL